MEKSMVKGAFLDRVAREDPTEKVTFEGDKKEQAKWLARGRMSCVCSAIRATSVKRKEDGGGRQVPDRVKAPRPRQGAALCRWKAIASQRQRPE